MSCNPHWGMPLYQGLNTVVMLGQHRLFLSCGYHWWTLLLILLSPFVVDCLCPPLSHWRISSLLVLCGSDSCGANDSVLTEDGKVGRGKIFICSLGHTELLEILRCPSHMACGQRRILQSNLIIKGEVELISFFEEGRHRFVVFAGGMGTQFWHLQVVIREKERPHLRGPIYQCVWLVQD